MPLSRVGAGRSRPAEYHSTARPYPTLRPTTLRRRGLPGSMPDDPVEFAAAVSAASEMI